MMKNLCNLYQDTALAKTCFMTLFVTLSFDIFYITAHSPIITNLRYTLVNRRKLNFSERPFLVLDTTVTSLCYVTLKV